MWKKTITITGSFPFVVFVSPLFPFIGFEMSCCTTAHYMRSGEIQPFKDWIIGQGLHCLLLISLPLVVLEDIW
jgi:hypothetical protein